MLIIGERGGGEDGGEDGGGAAGKAAGKVRLCHEQGRSFLAITAQPAHR